jgi:hypothetical protein
VRIVVVEQDSPTLRARLRSIGFDYLVRRPVHSEALRLLLLRGLYRGTERREATRVPVGSEVSFRAGALARRAVLADLSIGGCRLLTHAPLEEGARLVVQVGAEDGRSLALAGTIVRIEKHRVRRGGDALHACGFAFDPLPDATRARLAERISEHDRASGIEAGEREVPATAHAAPDGGEPDGQTPVEVRMERRSEDVPVTTRAGDELAERRARERIAYDRTVPAFGGRALRVLVGRDLSTGGMRIERLPELELGDRLHLAIYGRSGEEPLLVWATVARDDGEEGMGVVFDAVHPVVAECLERLVASLPSVEALQGDEASAMGTVVTEILEA